MWSLPLVVPHDDLWRSSTNRLPQFAPPTDPTGSQNNPQAQSQAIANRRTASHAAPFRSQLALLTADENAIEQRKQNVRRFGAAWLRPPGVAKTFQARMDEEQERVEQAEIARREAQMIDMAAVVEGEMGGDAEAHQEDEEERDLDADVPDAEDAVEDESDAGSTAEVTFNEESLLEGSADGDGQQMLELEEAELSGRLQDERDVGLERDLDDSIPEAGSYQHTDTEAEDDSSDSSRENDLELPQSFLRRAPGLARMSGGNGRSRRSLMTDQTDILGSSSFIGSSPAVGRGSGQDGASRSGMQRRRERRGV